MIAGYGPTGAVAANLFGASGLRVLVVEPSKEIFDIPRAVHFDGEVMRIFQQLGLNEEILEVAQEGLSLEFVNGRNWTLLHQELKDLRRHNWWSNNYFFNQPLLEAHLRKGVQRYPNVEVKLGCSVDHFIQNESAIRVSLTDQPREELSIDCGYLLGCDGASSVVRQCLEIVQEDLLCDEPWLVVDLEVPEGITINRQAYQICDPVRPTTLVPCEGQHIRWEFMVNPEDDWAHLESEETVRAFMAPHLHRLSPQLKPEQGKLLRAKVYSFHALLADSFQKGRVFLLGDAAHQMPPFLGQGMCAGIRDVYNLHWKMVGVLNAGYVPDLLSSYSSERRPHVYETIKTAVSHGSVIQNRSHVLSFFRDCFLKLGRAMPLLVSFLRLDLAWSLGEGVFDQNNAPEAGDLVGQPIPQTTLKVKGESILSDEVLGEGFTVVGFNCDPGDYLDELNVDELLGHGVLKLLKIEDGSEIVDEGPFSAWAELHEIDLAVIRPDRQVYGVLRANDDKKVELPAMLSRLQRKLEGKTL